MDYGHKMPKIIIQISFEENSNKIILNGGYKHTKSLQLPKQNLKNWNAMEIFVCIFISIAI